MAEETSIQKSGSTELATIGADSPLFQERYGDMVKTVMSDLPTKSTLQKILDDLPEELREKAAKLLKKMYGSRTGRYGETDAMSLTELKINYGGGTDVNKPDRLPVGDLYLTTCVALGEDFQGAVLTTVNGHAMWDEDDRSGPKCRSMDRKYGTKHGECEHCLHKPWRNGERQLCTRDVTVYMIPKTLDDIVLIRFTKTSEQAGTKLLKLIDKDMENWSKWYKVHTVKDANKKGITYYKFDCAPTGESTQDSLDAFFQAMCRIIEVTYVLPNIARVYKQAEDTYMGGAPAPVAAAANSAVDTTDYSNVPRIPDEADGV